MSFDSIRASEMGNYIRKHNVTIIDLRDRDDYIAGHIPSAVNIPYEDLEVEKSKLKKYNLLVLYCDRGHISLLAARDLIKEGYSIKSLYGGIRAYRGRLEKGI